MSNNISDVTQTVCEWLKESYLAEEEASTKVLLNRSKKLCCKKKII